MKSSNSLIDLCRSGSRLAVSAILCTLLFSGCAGTPRWSGELVPEPDAQRHAALLDSLVARDRTCPPTLLADLKIDYHSPVDDRKLQGFLQFSLPENYKFVVTNPLGQMVWATAGDRQHYQTVNTLRHQYIEGGMDSFVLTNKLPVFLLESDWGSWLTGRLQYGADRIVDIRNDPETPGIWITVKTDSAGGPLDHLLIDPAEALVLRRTITDADNTELATISYRNILPVKNSGAEESAARCKQPHHITVSGLPWGSRIELQLTNTETRSVSKSYSLPMPPRYFRQYRP